MGASVNPLDLEDQRILVTGASSGIGRATAVLVSRLGARVGVMGRDLVRTKETLDQLEGSGHCMRTWDFSTSKDPQPVVKEVAGELGGLTGVVHSAGQSLTRPLRFQDPDEVRSLMELNTNSAIWVAKAFRHKSICPAGGSLVFLSSVAALKGEGSIAAYAASKGALIALSRALAAEFARDRIRVNCVAPGLVQTEMFDRMRAAITEEQLEAMGKCHPLGLGEAIDVAHAIAFLLSSAGRWITGSTLVVDGGYTACN